MASLRFPVVEHVNAANAITSLSVASAVVGLVFASRGAVLPALAACAFCVPCDTLDGIVARRLNLTSSFGAQLDSLADALAFCILPAMIGHALGMTGPFVALLVWFVLGGLWRLARFEQVGMTEIAGRKCFQGVPTTVVAGLLFPLTVLVISLPHSARLGLLAAFFALGPLLHHTSAFVPKSGLHTKALWAAVPLSLAALFFRLG